MVCVLEVFLLLELDLDIVFVNLPIDLCLALVRVSIITRESPTV